MSKYKPRLFQPYDNVEITGIRLKPYTIAAEGRETIEINHALEYAEHALAESSIPWMRHFGLGYLMYHAGEDGNWFLLRAWIEGDIQVGMICGDYGKGFKPLTVPGCECVWEAVVACHERNAWVKHMMGDVESPDGYLSDKLSEGFH